MVWRLETRLELYRSLTEEERNALSGLAKTRKTLARGDLLAEEGVRRRHVYVVLEGVIQEHRTLQAGVQQILALHLPGDVVGLAPVISTSGGHGLCALTRASVHEISETGISALISDKPDLGRVLWKEMARGSIISQEWMVSLGHRSAYGRTAHLMCELFVRFAAIDAVVDGGCAFPLTQSDLADVLGLSVVHVNRVLQKLRSERLVSVGAGRFVVENWAALADAAGFDPAYLDPLGAVEAKQLELRTH